MLPSVVSRALLLVVVLLVGCDQAQEGAAQKALEASGVEGSLKIFEDGSRTRYLPPEDGQLSIDQVQQYLQVRHELVGRLESPVDLEPLPPPQDPLLEIALDERISRQLGFDPEEYLWVRGQVLDTQLALGQEQLDQKLLEILQGNLDDLEANRDRVPQGEGLRIVDEQISSLREEIEAARSRPSRDLDRAMRANVELIRPIIAELTELDSRIQAFRAVDFQPPSNASTDG